MSLVDGTKASKELSETRVLHINIHGRVVRRHLLDLTLRYYNTRLECFLVYNSIFFINTSNNAGFKEAHWLNGTPHFFTVRNEVAKVMFVTLSTVGGGGLPQCMLRYPPGSTQPPPPQSRRGPPRNTPTPWTTPSPGSRPPHFLRITPRSRHPSSADGYCCGWYASYLNVFL